MKSLKIGDQTVFFKNSERILKNEIVNPASFIITSPPYWDLKNYGHANEIGQEDYKTVQL